MNFLPFFFPFPLCFLAWQQFHSVAYKQERGGVLTWPKYDQWLHCARGGFCHLEWGFQILRPQPSSSGKRAMTSECPLLWAWEEKLKWHGLHDFVNPDLLWILRDPLGSTLILISAFSFGFEIQPVCFLQSPGTGKWNTCYLYNLCLPSRTVWWEEHGFESHTEWLDFCEPQ